MSPSLIACYNCNELNDINDVRCWSCDATNWQVKPGKLEETLIQTVNNGFICSKCMSFVCATVSPTWETEKLWCPICNQNTKWIENPKYKKQRNGLPEFYTLLEEAAVTHEKKFHDYATNSDPTVNYRTAGKIAKLFKDDTDAGLAGRFAEKVMRLIVLDNKETGPLNESIEDTETDILVIVGLFVANRRKRRAESK